MGQTRTGLSLLLVAGLAAGAIVVQQRLHPSTASAARVAPKQIAAATALLASRPAVPWVSGPEVPGRPLSELRKLVLPLPPQRLITRNADLELRGGGFLDRMPRAVAPAFRRLPGPASGINPVPLPRWYQLSWPQNELAPLAAGDINADGWPDLAFGTSAGPRMYLNLGGRFARVALDLPSLRDWTVSYLALVDLDGDGALDLFVCGWMQGCRILYNHGGIFGEADQLVLPRGREVLTTAVAFADLARTGRLDIILSGDSGLGYNFSPVDARITVLHALGGRRYRAEGLPGPSGETLSMHVVDLNGDGWPDLLAGVDFDEPDLLYLSDKGRLRLQHRSGSLIPLSTHTTMSVDSADLEGDGRLSLYEVADGEKQQPPAGVASAQSLMPAAACQNSFADDPVDREHCTAIAGYVVATRQAEERNTPEPCTELTDVPRQRDCIVASSLFAAARNAVPASGGNLAAVTRTCRLIPAEYVQFRDMCQAASRASLDRGQFEKTTADYIPQAGDGNRFLTQPSPAGRFKDATRSTNTSFGGWSWNARFVDLTNAGRQDLFVSQGWWNSQTHPSNLFYRNLGGGQLADQSREYGLEDHVPTGTSVFPDVNQDGRPDIVTGPFRLTPVVWRNDQVSDRSVEIALRQRADNHDAIGATVVITAPDGSRQSRLVKASGGYQSDDVKTARFGLGFWPSVASVQVTWPDGRSDRIDGLTLTRGRYTLTRLAA